MAIYGAIVGLFSYLDSTVEPTKSDLLVTAMGECAIEEHFSYGWWQDGGTYSKYTYKSADLNNEYLSPIEKSDIGDIKLNISEFELNLTIHHLINCRSKKHLNLLIHSIS